MDSSRYSVTIPRFTPDKIQLWFGKMELFFTLSNVTDDQMKFAYVATHLNTKYADMLEEMILAPPQENRYLTIKRAVVNCHLLEQEKKLRETLQKEQIGNLTPSEFLVQLKKLEPSAPKNIVLEVWLSIFPNLTRELLMKASETEDWDKLGAIADEIFSISKKIKVDDGKDEKIRKLTDEVKDLKIKLSESETMLQKCRKIAKSALFPEIHQFYQPNQSAPRFAKKKTSVCWYHALFGDKAHKCQGVCVLSSKFYNNK